MAGTPQAVRARAVALLLVVAALAATTAASHAAGGAGGVARWRRLCSSAAVALGRGREPAPRGDSRRVGGGWVGVRRPLSTVSQLRGGASAQEACYLRVKRGGARNSGNGRGGGDGYGDYGYGGEGDAYGAGDDQYYNDQYYGGQQGGAPQQGDWGDWDDGGAAPPDYWPDDDRRGGQRRSQQGGRGGRRRNGDGGGGSPLSVGGVDVGTVITQGNKKWGITTLVASFLMTAMGISLFFNKFLIRLGNMGLVAGAALLVGPPNFLRYFCQPSKLRGTVIFAIGFFLVFTGHPILGIAAEVFGFLNLFGNMLPMLLVMARSVPGLGDLIPKGGGGGGGRRSNGGRRSGGGGGGGARRRPPPPQDDDMWGDGGDGYGNDGYGGDGGYGGQPQYSGYGGQPQYSGY